MVCREGNENLILGTFLNYFISNQTVLMTQLMELQPILVHLLLLLLYYFTAFSDGDGSANLLMAELTLHVAY